MSNAIAVLNAGSSSVKFSLFIARGDDLELHVRGQIEGIDTAPHFIAKDRDGAPTTEKSWPAGRISTPGARASAWSIPTNGELMIARHTGRLLQ